MSLEDSILSETSQTQRDKHWVTHLHRSLAGFTETEHRMVGARG